MELDVRREEEGKWEFSDWLGRDLAGLGGEMGLLGIVQEDESVTPAGRTYGGADLSGHDLGKVAPTRVGRDFYELMELHRIPDEEKRDISRLLSGQPAEGRLGGRADASGGEGR